MRVIKDKDILRTLESLVGFHSEKVVYINPLDPQMKSIGFDSVSLHHYEKATEWYVIDDGHFQIILEDKIEEFHCKDKKQTLIFVFSPGERHGIKALTYTYVWVLKNFHDEAIF